MAAGPHHDLQSANRACGPASTVKRLKAIASEIGLTRVANITGLDVIGVPVWIAVRPNSRGLSTSQGKGLTDDAAKASAMMESVETWHAETIDHALRVESVAGLRQKANIIDVDRLSFHEANPPRSDLPMIWIEGVDLGSDEPCWTPLDTVSTNYVQSASWSNSAVFFQSSNGLAGGNTRAEAIAHAMAEVIERDAIALNAVAMRRFEGSRRVSLSTITHPDCVDILTRFESAGLMTAVFDLTSDLGVPVVGCSIVDGDEQTRWRALPPFSGYGCNANADIALFRALTEAAQSRLTYISGTRDDISFADYRRGGNAEDLAATRALMKGPASASLPQGSERLASSAEDNIALMRAALGRSDIHSVVVVDLTKPRFDIPVVKVVIPGMAPPVPPDKRDRIRVPARPAAKGQTQ